ncbi:MAG TPA: hypothetical protein VIV11_25910, partial [Kofleriaceae bacterium]
GTGDGGSGDSADGGSPETCTFGTRTLIAPLMSAGEDYDVGIRHDGTTLAFASNRTVDFVIYSSVNSAGTWSSPTVEPVLDSTSPETSPTWNYDGTELYFTSSRTGPSLTYVASYTAGGFGTPTLAPGLEAIEILNITLSRDGLELFGTVPPFPTRIVRAVRATRTAPWQVVDDVPELDDPAANDGWAGLSPDALTIYFESNRSTSASIWSATRAVVGGSFTTPEPVAELNAPQNTESDPEVSFDGSLIYFGGSSVSGDHDVYTAPRICN